MITLLLCVSIKFVSVNHELEAGWKLMYVGVNLTSVGLVFELQKDLVSGVAYYLPLQRESIT